MIDDKQAVATEPDTGKLDEGTGAPEDLDTILSEFDEKDEQVKTAEPTKPDAQDKDMGARIDSLQRQITESDEKGARKDTEEAIGKTVTEVAQLLPEGVKVPTRALRGYIEMMALEDRRLATAFLQRHLNPRKWETVKKAMAVEIAKDFEIDEAATAERDSVASAVRSASTKAPADTEVFDEKKVQGMGRQELYEKYPDLAKVT